MNENFLKKLEQDIQLFQAIKDAKKEGSKVPSYYSSNARQALQGRFETLWNNRDYETFNEGLNRIKADGFNALSKQNAIWERHTATKLEELTLPQEFKQLKDMILTLKEEVTNEKYDFIVSHNVSKLKTTLRYKSLAALAEIAQSAGVPTDSALYKSLTARQDPQLQAPQSEEQDDETDGILYQSDVVRVENDAEDCRVRLYFNGKPSADVRTELKRNGFRWSPSNEAWQRQNTNNGIAVALQLAKKLSA